MSKTFKRGDHVEWNSEAGRVRGTVVKKVVSEVKFKGYTHHATKEGTSVFHQERQNRSRRNSQRLSSSAFEAVAQKEREEIIAKNETLRVCLLNTTGSPVPSPLIVIFKGYIVQCRAPDKLEIRFVGRVSGSRDPFEEVDFLEEGDVCDRW